MKCYFSLKRKGKNEIFILNHTLTTSEYAKNEDSIRPRGSCFPSAARGEQKREVESHFLSYLQQAVGGQRVHATSRRL